ERFLKAVSPIFHEKKMDKPAAPEAPPSPVILPHRDYLFVKGDAKNKYHKLILEDISYVEGLRNYVQFFCRDQKVVTLQNLKRLEEDLPADRFVRIHKSYIVHIDHIDEIEGQSVLINGRRLPIGQSYRTRFFSLIRDHRIGE
ncbi:MAG: LytTR family DNA-binding domain-containing protein, partial [Bacteroidota bacterium]